MRVTTELLSSSSALLISSTMRCVATAMAPGHRRPGPATSFSAPARSSLRAIGTAPGQLSELRWAARDGSFDRVFAELARCAEQPCVRALGESPRLWAFNEIPNADRRCSITPQRGWKLRRCELQQACGWEPPRSLSHSSTWRMNSGLPWVRLASCSRSLSSAVLPMRGAPA